MGTDYGSSDLLIFDPGMCVMAVADSEPSRNRPDYGCP